MKVPFVSIFHREKPQIYALYHRDLIAFENECGTGKSLEKFNETLNIIRRRHLDTVPLMAQAVIKLNHSQSTSDGVNETIQYFLDRLYINRYVRTINVIF